jgi:hypothetical protein
MAVRTLGSVYSSQNREREDSKPQSNPWQLFPCDRGAAIPSPQAGMSRGPCATCRPGLEPEREE